MKVTLEYHDTESLTVEEIVRQAQQNYGKAVKVEIMPDSMLAYDLISHGAHMLLAYEQVSILHDDKQFYQLELQKLRARVITKVSEIIDQVIIDIESKVT